jgi:hypothetical protein
VPRFGEPLPLVETQPSVLLLDIASEAIVDILALPLQRRYFGLRAIISGLLPPPQTPVR